MMAEKKHQDGAQRRQESGRFGAAWNFPFRGCRGFFHFSLQALAKATS